jgi:NADH:ubiquinone oxidoreductase subunit 3 (subunit A)
MGVRSNPVHDILLSPVVAFPVYLILVGLLFGLGRVLAGPAQASEAKSSTYSGGESAPQHPAAPGYRPFFVIALFFAILHLGVLILGSSDLSATAGVYLVGLMLALVALILG